MFSCGRLGYRWVGLGVRTASTWLQLYAYRKHTNAFLLIPQNYPYPPNSPKLTQNLPKSPKTAKITQNRHTPTQEERLLERSMMALLVGLLRRVLFASDMSAVTLVMVILGGESGAEVCVCARKSKNTSKRPDFPTPFKSTTAKKKTKILSKTSQKIPQN